MNLLTISGSPRFNSNTEILLSHAAEPFLEKGWTVNKVNLKETKITGCVGCDKCANTNVCAITDDMIKVYEYFKVCDAVLIGSPAYYRNVTSQLKALFDRSYAIRKTKVLQGKPGGAIAVGRGADGGQSIVLNIIYNFFLSSGMLCVPGELNGVSATADKPGDIANDTYRINLARKLGENVLNISEGLYKN